MTVVDTMVTMSVMDVTVRIEDYCGSIALD